MKTTILSSFLFGIILVLSSCNNQSSEFKTINADVLRDKIAGGWAGKMIGVTYGAPTEFRAQGKIFTDSINWKPSDVKEVCGRMMFMSN